MVYRLRTKIKVNHVFLLRQENLFQKEQIAHKQQHQSVYNITSCVAECSLCGLEVADFKKFFVHLLAHNNSRAFQVNHKMVRLVKVKDNATMMVSADEICMTALNPKSVTIQPISSVKVSFTEAGSLKAAIAGSAPATQTSTVTSSSQQHAQIRPVALLKETERLTQSQTAEFPIKTENCDVIMLDD